MLREEDSGGSSAAYGSRNRGNRRSDFSVKTTNFDKEYYKWALVAKPEGDKVEIQLIRKGLDADVTESATLDAKEGALVIKNETFRK